MRKTFTIDTPEQLKALSDSRRLELVKHLVEQPLTAAQLADAVGRDKSQLYYHLNELQAHDLIEVVESRQKGNLIEKVYRATAGYYAIDRSLFQNEHGMEMMSVSVNSILDSAAADIHKLANSDMSANEIEARLLHFHRLIRIPENRREEFGERFDELLKEFDCGDLNDKKDQYTWTMILCPLPGSS